MISPRPGPPPPSPPTKGVIGKMALPFTWQVQTKLYERIWWNHIMFLLWSFETKMNFIKEQPKSVAQNLQLSVITHKFPRRWFMALSAAISDHLENPTTTIHGPLYLGRTTLDFTSCPFWKLSFGQFQIGTCSIIHSQIKRNRKYFPRSNSFQKKNCNTIFTRIF